MGIAFLVILVIAVRICAPFPRSFVFIVCRSIHLLQLNGLGFGSYADAGNETVGFSRGNTPQSRILSELAIGVQEASFRDTASGSLSWLSGDLMV